MRKTLAVAALVVASLGAAGPAFAGEITGSGKGGPNHDGTPGGTLNASSECAFSGLADGGEGEPSGPGNVQNWGHVDRDFFRGIGVTPGTACNGNGGGGEP